MTTDAELDAKLTRLADRVRARGEATRAELERIGATELAELCRETFDAKLVYLGPADDPRLYGRPYDFSLGGQRRAPAPVERPITKRKRYKRRPAVPRPIPPSFRDRAAGDS